MPGGIALLPIIYIEPCPIQPRVNISMDLVDKLSASMKAGRHQPLLEVEPAIPILMRTWTWLHNANTPDLRSGDPGIHLKTSRFNAHRRRLPGVLAKARLLLA